MNITDNSNDLTYAPLGKNSAGQLVTPSTVRQGVGRPADQITMPSDDARMEEGVRVGTLLIVPSAGFLARVAEVITEEGKTLRGDGALWAIYSALKAEALKAEQEARS